jgi:hypothetical protein
VTFKGGIRPDRPLPARRPSVTSAVQGRCRGRRQNGATEPVSIGTQALSAPAITRVPANASVAAPASRTGSCANPSWRVPGAPSASATATSRPSTGGLVTRRGDTKAIVAVAHSILVIAYHLLRDGQSYRELGSDYFDHLNAQRLTRYHTQRLAALGYAVTLTKSAA